MDENFGNDITFSITNDDDNKITGTDKNDKLKERDTNSIIDTGAGNDNIQDYSGDDIIYGGQGNDKIFDYSGNDSILGGSGNDEIHDFDGNDTYIFAKGDGQDSLYDLSNNTNDIVKFASDVSKDDIAFFRKGNTLTLSYGDNDQLTIYNQGNKNHGIETFELNDGGFFTDADVNKVIQDMAAFASGNDISLTNVEDVRNNQELMNIIANSWHAA